MIDIDPKSPARWSDYKHFTKSQFDCKHTGKNEMKHSFMLKLDRLAEECGFRIKVSSGFRDITHPEEAKKETPGAHSEGVAADLIATHEKAYIILDEAFALRFTGVGIKQKGSGRYIHVDDAEARDNRPRPHVWTY